MCGIAGYIGLGHLDAAIRFDLVEALGDGIDKRGGHAAGAVMLYPESPPRMQRALGKWNAKRGRFIRSAAAGSGVLMHSRYATHGSKDSVENAHPFAIKRTSDKGVEYTSLYGCHNGVMRGTEETARSRGRKHTVDSLELLELLADKEYDAIRALRGYGVLAFVKPRDHAVCLLRLSDNSDLHVVELAGGGYVWGSTQKIVTEACEYAGLELDCELNLGKVGMVYTLSDKNARETNITDLKVKPAANDSRTSGGSTNHYTNHYAWTGPGAMHYEGRVYDWDEACYLCGELKQHVAGCKFSYSVIPKETIKMNMREYREAVEKAFRENMPVTDTGAAGAPASESYAECDDGTWRKTVGGSCVPFAFPIYVREWTTKGVATGEYRLCSSYYQASETSGQSIKPDAKPLGHVVPDGSVTEPVGHNGHWSMPPGISRAEEDEWLESVYGLTREDMTRVAEDTEDKDIPGHEYGLEFARQMLKG